jgi:RNA ligase (TIGR02306 family)
MSTFKVTVEKLEILPHPNADALELAKVGEYRAVVAKGAYKTGDWALYIPEQAVLPPELLEEIGLTGKLAGKDKNRVKAIRLRGEISQGIVCRPKALPHLWRGEDFEDQEWYEKTMQTIGDTDFAEDLGITKWVPPIPVGMAGEVEAAPNLLPWCEIENIKRYPAMFEPGEEVVATEKIHGTCFLLTYDAEEDQAWITSKGMGGKNLALKQSDTNLYWRAAVKYNLPRLALSLADRYNAVRVGLYGEVFGKGVQDLHYGAAAGSDSTLGFALFDAAIQPGLPGEVPRFLGAEFFRLDVTAAAWAASIPVRTVPILYQGPYDYDMLAKLAEGKETVSGREFHLREGLVVRPAVEARSELTGGRKIAKFINPDYLVRGGDVTEYE